MKKDLENTIPALGKAEKKPVRTQRAWLEKWLQRVQSDPEWQRLNPPEERLAREQMAQAERALAKIQTEARLLPIRQARARNKRRTPLGDAASIRVFLDQSPATSQTLRERVAQDADIDPTQAYEDSRKLMEFCLERLLEQEKTKA